MLALVHFDKFIQLKVKMLCVSLCFLSHHLLQCQQLCFYSDAAESGCAIQAAADTECVF